MLFLEVQEDEDEEYDEEDNGYNEEYDEMEGARCTISKL